MYKITKSNRQIKKKNVFACNRCPICSHLKSVFFRLCPGMFAINISQCDKWPKIHLVLQAIPPQNSSKKMCCVSCRVIASHRTVNITVLLHQHEVLCYFSHADASLRCPSARYKWHKDVFIYTCIHFTFTHPLCMNC